ncbi:hypothetical protein AAC03nite_39260 [Alicyclobacillus acidoterrestris]|nr:hypothetical protein AAC03nite_39260 [Alicyclobacillus acidoterrestris]
MRTKIIATVATTLMLSTVPTMAFASVTNQNPQSSQSTVTERQFTFDQPLSRLSNLTYGDTTQDQANQKTADAISQIFGDDASNVLNAKNGKIHFYVTTTTDNSTGNTQIQASGYIQLDGSTRYSITCDQSELDSVSTSLGTLEKAEIPGTLTTPSGKSYDLNIGVAYIPNTNNYQATVLIDGLGYPVTLDFGKGFITKPISDDIVASNNAKNKNAITNTTNSTMNATPSLMSAQSSGTLTRPEQHFLGDKYSTVLDGSTDYFGNNTPTEVMRASNGPSGSGQYIEDEVWGTNQVENYLGGTGRAISVNEVDFAVSVPNDDWNLENVFYPAPVSPPTFNFSAISWIIDSIPALGAASGLVQQIADQNIVVGGGIVNKAPNNAYLNQINWTDVNTDELTGAYDPPANKPAYDQEFFGNPVSGQKIQVDASVRYENDAYSIGYIEYDTTPMMYMPSTIEPA